MAIDLSRITKYLNTISPVSAVINASDGLVTFYKGISEEEAENLAAWATQLVSTARTKIGLPDPSVAVFFSGEGDILVAASGNESIVVLVKPGYGEYVATAITGKGPYCQRCGEDLSMAIVECPQCGSKQPFGATHCSECGSLLAWRKCPSCGATIDDRGRPLSWRERVFSRSVKVSIVR